MVDPMDGRNRGAQVAHRELALLDVDMAKNGNGSADDYSP